MEFLLYTPPFLQLPLCALLCAAGAVAVSALRMLGKLREPLSMLLLGGAAVAGLLAAGDLLQLAVLLFAALSACLILSERRRRK